MVCYVTLSNVVGQKLSAAFSSCGVHSVYVALLSMLYAIGYVIT